MFEQRNLKTDLLALALLALAIFLGASMFSYDLADPPSKLVYPARSATLNVCGRSGALASTLLFTGFGFGAYYLLFSLAVVDSVLLFRRTISQPLLRMIGWLVSFIGFTTLIAMAFPQWSPGPVIGSGGYLGAAGRGLLEMHFANVGAYILVVSLILGGLLLSTDYVLLGILAWTVGLPAKGLGRGVVRVGKAYSGRMAKRRSDLDPYAAEGKGHALPVRIAGRSNESQANGAGTEPVEDHATGQDNAPTVAPEADSADADKSLRIRKPAKSSRKKELEEIDAVATDPQPSDYEMPSLDLLLPSEPFCFDAQEKDVRRKAGILEKTFTDFGFNIRVVEIQTGPVVAQFEVELEAGLRLSKITGLADDLAIALRVPSVRIVAPIPGKNTVGIEVPNSERQLVRIREVMEETSDKVQAMRIPIFLGKDVAGNPMIVDLSSLPHLLIAGRTGTGKSVCLNSIIVSLLMTRRPDEVRMLLIDPKMVELSPYKSIPHLMHPVVTDMRKAEAILAWAVEKMEERYHLLARAGVRHVSVYNQLGEEELMERIQPESDEEREQIPLHLPYIVIVADEMADLMMTAAKEVEGHIIRLAQKSRAVGIHLVAATQKPTVDVITGLIKSNLPARICFQVASRTDSRVVLDEMGADKLLGNGDMLFLWPGTSTLLRGQGTYLSDDEIARVIESVATTEPQFVKELVQLKTSEPGAGGVEQLKSRDDLYEAAIDIVVREGRGSVSLLQRTLGIGYGRAARLIDYMAEDGLVGVYNGSQAREVLITVEEWDKRRGADSSGNSGSSSGSSSGRSGSGGAATPPRRGNKILLSPSRQDEDPAESETPAPVTSTARRTNTREDWRLRPVPRSLKDDAYDEEEEDSAGSMFTEVPSREHHDAAAYEDEDEEVEASEEFVDGHDSVGTSAEKDRPAPGENVDRADNDAAPKQERRGRWTAESA